MTAVVNALKCPLGNNLIEDTAVDGTIQENVTGATSVIYYISIDNSNNTSTVYFKIWDSVTPDISTDDPSYIFKVTKTNTLTLHIPEGLQLTNALSYGCVTSSQSGVGTAPTKTVTVRIITS